MPKTKVRAEGPLPSKPIWQTISEDTPGFKIHCLIDENHVRGRIHTYFAWITDVVSVVYDDDTVPEEFDIYPDLDHGSAAHRLKRRAEYPENYIFTDGHENEGGEITPYATLELAKAALEALHIRS